MCFLMGAAAGGMLPVTYALLAETMPSKQRGWALVLVGGLGAAGGYLAASALSAWLVPILSWRILWFLNLPTGLALIFLNVFIPESPKFLLALGRVREAHAVLRRFGCVVREGALALPARSADAASRVAVPQRVPRPDRRPQHRRARLGPDQLRPPALDAGAPRRQGLQHGRLQRPARGLGADRGADGVRRRVALQPLEQQGRAHRRDRAVRRRPARPDPPRAVVAAGRQPGARHRAPHRRHQRDHRDDPAVCGRELPAAGARPCHGLGGGLHQGGRPGGAAARPARPRPGAGAGRPCWR